MILGLAHHAAAPAFNADFYVAAVTVIPVLFLALAVQGSTYQDMITAYTRFYERPEHGERQPVPLRLAADLIPLAFGFVLMFAVVGEIEAIFALYWRRPEGGLTVALAAMVLVFAVAAVPVAAVVRFVRGEARPPLAFSLSTTDVPEPPAAADGS